MRQETCIQRRIDALYQYIKLREQQEIPKHKFYIYCGGGGGGGLRGGGGCMGARTCEEPAPSALGGRKNRSGATWILQNWPVQRTKNTIIEFTRWDSSSCFWRKGSIRASIICPSFAKICAVSTSRVGTDASSVVLADGFSCGCDLGAAALFSWRGGSGKGVSWTSTCLTLSMRELAWIGRRSDDDGGDKDSWFRVQTVFYCTGGVCWAFLVAVGGLRPAVCFRRFFGCASGVGGAWAVVGARSWRWASACNRRLCVRVMRTIHCSSKVCRMWRISSWGEGSWPAVRQRRVTRPGRNLRLWILKHFGTRTLIGCGPGPKGCWG